MAARAAGVENLVAATGEAESGDDGDEEADSAVKPASFLVFVLYLDHDAFSDELVEVVEAVAGLPRRLITMHAFT